MPKITDDRPADIDSDAPANSEQLARQQAIQQIRARRRFKVSTASAAVGVTLLVPIWAATEYRNAGGWPTRGFSQRSGIPREPALHREREDQAVARQAFVRRERPVERDAGYRSG